MSARTSAADSPRKLSFFHFNPSTLVPLELVCVEVLPFPTGGAFVGVHGTLQAAVAATTVKRSQRSIGTHSGMN